MKGLFKVLFGRFFLVVMLLLLQIIILVGAIWKLSNYFTYVYFFFVLISLLVVLKILNKDDNPAYKLAWTIPILLFPVFGGLFYLLLGGNRSTRLFKQSTRLEYAKAICFLHQDEHILEEIAAKNANVYAQSRYLSQTCSYPVYKNTLTEYLSPGEEMFRRLKEELEKARHYIFMEYFIVEEGEMWDSILEIMVRKAQEGLDVRMMYDDAGCLKTLPYQYHLKLEEMGIKTLVFQPFTPKLTVRLNNRDHRKITVIDGHTGFCGGINLADEYINKQERFGHWKDASIYLKGEAVWSLTFMFLHLWNSTLKRSDDYECYLPHVHHPQPFESDGYVQPYGDSPLEDETVGAMVYLNLINKAKDYVYINTPYMVSTHELSTALILAAKNGVDVRIVTPAIGDKWYVHAVTRSSYEPLIEAGVKVYEYTPGFMHSKTFLSDDEVATVGTVNMDYRSFYLHFECGVWMYQSRAVTQLKQDFLETLALCRPITLEECRNVPWHTHLIQMLLKIFAPLM